MTENTSTQPRPQPRTAEKPWLLVARREVLTRLTDKSFLSGTLITFLLIIGFIGFQVWSEDRTETVTVAATAEAGDTARLLAEGVPEIDGSLEVEVTDVASDDAGVDLVREGEADVLLRPTDDGWTLVGDEDVSGDLSSAAETVVRNAAISANAAEAGNVGSGSSRPAAASAPSCSRATPSSRASPRGWAWRWPSSSYFTALGFGYTLSGSIVEEKSNRIVEIITTKIPVRQLLIGKIAGNTLLAIGQTALMVVVGLVGISFTEYSSFLPALGRRRLVRRLLRRRLHLHRLLVGRRRRARQSGRGPADDRHPAVVPDDGGVLRGVPVRGHRAHRRVVRPAVLLRADADAGAAGRHRGVGAVRRDLCCCSSRWGPPWSSPSGSIAGRCCRHRAG